MSVVRPSRLLHTAPRAPRDRHLTAHQSVLSRISTGYPAPASRPYRGSPSTDRRSGPARPPAAWHRDPIQCRKRDRTFPAGASSAPARRPVSARDLRLLPSACRTDSSAFPSDDAIPTPIRRYKPRGSHSSGTSATQAAGLTAKESACLTALSQDRHRARSRTGWRANSARPMRRHRAGRCNHPDTSGQNGPCCL